MDILSRDVVAQFGTDYEKMVRGVIKGFGGIKGFCDYAEDVCTYGMVAGFGQFVYYSDTCAFYDKYESEIKMWICNYVTETDLDVKHLFAPLSVNNAEVSLFMSGLINEFNEDELLINCSIEQLKNHACWLVVEAVCDAACCID